MSVAHAFEEIRSEPRPACALCGNHGTFIHLGLSDRLFGAPGRWNLKRCVNPNCGLIWLDPMPLIEDIGKAYRTYYTHDAPQIDTPGELNWLRRSYRLIKLSYLADRYGYETGVKRWLASWTGKILYMFPSRRRNVDGFVRSVRWVPQGKLLDVGCGSGLFLMIMRQLGWHVEGVDFDNEVVGLAKQQGLNVHHCSLEQQNFANNSFDALVLNQVIEHVPDPVITLRECARVLRPGGQLVLFTPNGFSLAHRIFKQHWRGLEPPRHLHLFNPVSMRRLLNQTGFKNSSLRVDNSLFIWKETFKLWGEPRRDVLAKVAQALGPYLFMVLERCWLTLQSSAGETLSVDAVKQ